jgi:hypothetical protein
VRYSRTSSIAGFKVSGTFQVSNPHAAAVTLDKVGYAISRPDGVPVMGEATCNVKLEAEGQQQQRKDGTEAAAAAAAAAAGGTSQPLSSGAAPHRIKLAAVDADAEPSGNGPITCSFTAELPDSHPSSVAVFAVTDEGSSAEAALGTLDWSKAETTAVNK